MNKRKVIGACLAILLLAATYLVALLLGSMNLLGCSYCTFYFGLMTGCMTLKLAQKIEKKFGRVSS